MIQFIQIEAFFQFGPFITTAKSELFESLIGSLIGAGAALFVYKLEGNRQKIIERKKRENDLRDFFDYFKETFKSIIKLHENQLIDYRVQCRRFKEAPFEFHLLPFNSSQDLHRISEKLDMQILFHAYLLVNGRTDRIKIEFSNLISLVDNALKLHQQSWETQKSHFTYLESRLLEYKVLVEEQTLNRAVFICQGLRNEDPVNFRVDPFFSALEQLIYNYHSEEPEQLTIAYMQERLVEPMKNELLNNFRDIPDAFRLVDNCRKATWLYNEIISKSNSTAKDFQDFANSFRKNLSNLKKLQGCK